MSHIMLMYDCIRRSEQILFEEMNQPQGVCVFWLTHGEANVSRHLTGPKVTLAVTDQSGLAEQTSSPRLHCDAIIFHLGRKSHIDSCHYVTANLALFCSFQVLCLPARRKLNLWSYEKRS